MKIINKVLAFITVFTLAGLSYGQTAKETLEKRKIEKAIELGSGSFYINDNVGVGVSASANQILRISGINGKGLGLDLAGSTDYTIQESSTTDVVQLGASLYHNISSGFIGLGIVPTTKLDIDGGSSQTRIRVSSSGTGAETSGIILSNSTKTNYNDGIDIAHGAGNTTFRDLAGNAQMVFTPQSGGSGNVGIGVLPNFKLDVRGDIGDYIMYVSNNDTTTAGNGANIVVNNSSSSSRVIRAGTSSGEIFTVLGDGRIGVNAVNWASGVYTDVGISAASGAAHFVKHTSSIRYKEDVRPLEGDTEWIYKTKPVNFTYKNRIPNSLGGFSLGYIAEDISKIAPKEYVTWNDETKQEEGLAYNLFVVPIIEEMKKLKLNNKNLKGENTLMKAWICKQPDYPIALCGGQ